MSMCVCLVACVSCSCAVACAVGFQCLCACLVVCEFVCVWVCLSGCVRVLPSLVRVGVAAFFGGAVLQLLLHVLVSWLSAFFVGIVRT